MKEEIKKFAETITGIARPRFQDILIKNRTPNAFKFHDDGQTPNNSRLSLILYRSAVMLEPRFDPAAVFEVLFGKNGWGSSWRYTMYGYNHFHTQTHEVLGIARGRLTARFGGTHGRKIELKASDVVVIPAGVGHRHIKQSKDLLIVGAYPANGGKYDEPRPREVSHEEALERISKSPLPNTDPVYGKDGPIFSKWRKSQ